MQEFAPSKSRPSGNCPSDFELAAYIDGVLGEEEAARVTEHLAFCERCFEVYTETVHFQLESPPSTAGEVVEFPSNRWKDRAPWWLAAAAAVLVASVGSWYIYKSASVSPPKPTPPPQMVVADVTPDVGGRPLKELLWNYSKYRGGGESESKYARQSFQVGALLVDFHLTARAGDAEEASEIWRKIGVVVGDTPGMGELSKQMLAQANQISPDENPTGAMTALHSVDAQLSRVETALRDSLVFPEYFDFGKWTEAGRIAALTQGSLFFDDPQNRRFLSYSLKDWETEKPLEVRRRLESIKEIWERSAGLDPKAFETLAGHFQAILDQYDFRA